MKKFLNILSGVYFILVGIFLGLVFIGGLFFQSKANNLQMEKASSVVFLALFAIIFPLWPFLTGLGIILKRNWARFSVFMMSAFAIIVGLFASLTFLVEPIPQNAKADYKIVKLAFLGFSAVFFIAIPIFFIIFFNRKSIKEMFIVKVEEAGGINRPFGITFLAICSLVGGISTAVFIFQPYINQLPIGNLLLSGQAVRVYSVIVTLINLYVGIGLLKLWKRAWLTAILFHIFSILLGVLNILTISESTLSKVFSSANINDNMPLLYYKIIASLGLTFPLAVLVYLIYKRNLFKKSSAPVCKN